MRLLDAQFLSTPWYGSRQMARHLRRQGFGVAASGFADDAADGSDGHLPQAAKRRSLIRHIGSIRICSECADRSAEPGVVRRHHLHPDATRIPVSGGNHGLGDAYGAVLAPVEHAGQRLLYGGPGGGSGPVRQAEDLQYRPGVPIHQPGTSPRYSNKPRYGYRWTARAGGWTTSSSRRLWRSLKYECVYLHDFQDGAQARQTIGTWLRYYNEERPHSSHLHDRTPMEEYTRRRAA